MAPSPPTNPSPSDPLTFASLLPMTPTTSHTYTCILEDGFCVGTVPNGGYITSAFLIAARTHMSTTHPTLRCPHPINLHIEFLRRTSVGPATFTVKDVKLGRRISNLHLTLSQLRDPSRPEDDDNKFQDEVEGYITMTNMETETGPGFDTGYQLHPPPRPVDLSKLDRDEDVNYIRRRSDPYGNFRRATKHIQMHLVRPERRTSEYSPAVIDQWVRFRPFLPPSPSSSSSTSSTSNATTNTHHPGRWTNDALGYIVDIFPQINERYNNPEIEDLVLQPSSVISDAAIRSRAVSLSSSSSTSSTPKTQNNTTTGTGSSTRLTAPRTFWYPTLLLNLDVKKLLPDEGVEWLFVRVRSKKIHRGRFDLDVEVWNYGDGGGGGELVALSSHAALVMDASRNVTRKGKGKDVESQSKSKI